MNICTKLTITHFMPLSSFYTPWNHQKTTGFSGGIKRDQWHEISWKKTLKSWKKAFISIAYHVMEIHFLFYTFFYWAKHVIDEERKFIQKYSSYSLIFLSKISCFFLLSRIRTELFSGQCSLSVLPESIWKTEY